MNNKAKLIFITGPSGSGKSTTAKEVATNWPAMCSLLDFDRIRMLIKSGYAEPANGWNDDTEKQWELSKQVVMAMTKAYVDKGVSVVLEVFATPHDYPKWQELFGDIHYEAYALLPALSIVKDRNNKREGVSKLKERDVERNYDWSVGWLNTEGITVIDNGTANVIATANRIIELSK